MIAKSKLMISETVVRLLMHSQDVLQSELRAVIMQACSVILRVCVCVIRPLCMHECVRSFVCDFTNAFEFIFHVPSYDTFNGDVHIFTLHSSCLQRTGTVRVTIPRATHRDGKVCSGS